ncbi:uncharacterized protein LTR77_000775 [Saxophila tyrrhenica]|uniref:PSP1 C-terminal domain-containing protein n=1 Tax=Saxophila tyrrhenica TaxID=1690608 RepID=A0AAV9PPA3_9PEZI|nr:hypothetical protein LTR77_000775 [Saxophila tyrrhenica]
MKYHDLDDNGLPVPIPPMYKVPYVKLDDNERNEQDRRAGRVGNDTLARHQRSQNYSGNRSLYIVSFKCSRVEVFYLLENTGLNVKEGDIVIVEADRGQDLGTVQHAKVSHEEAREYKRKYDTEQYKWLMMFSKNNNQGNVNPNAQIYGESREMNGIDGRNLLANAPRTMQGNPRESFKTKAIKRLAGPYEIRQLADKEANEAKAKRTCQQKIAQLHVDMEVLDAEWQWDFQKLIFYFYADHYIDFKALVTELYRIYKVRIWMSAINPASFALQANGQPPSGVGPGAIMENGHNNNNYSMLYGADPDPYGAVPPYRIPSGSYNPKSHLTMMPGLGGNNFGPMGSMGGPNSQFPSFNNSFGDPARALYQPAAYGTPDGQTPTDPHPNVPPYVPTPTGSLEDYNYYYDRVSAYNQLPAATSAPSLYSHPPHANGFASFNRFFGGHAAHSNDSYSQLNHEVNRAQPNDFYSQTNSENSAQPTDFYSHINNQINGTQANGPYAQVNNEVSRAQPNGMYSQMNNRTLPPPANPTHYTNPFGPMQGGFARYPGFQSQRPIGSERPGSSGNAQIRGNPPSDRVANNQTNYNNNNRNRTNNGTSSADSFMEAMNRHLNNNGGGFGGFVPGKFGERK